MGKVIEGVKGVGLYSKRIKSDARKVIWAVPLKFFIFFRSRAEGGEGGARLGLCVDSIS